MPGVYEIYVRTHFSAAHQLHGYSGDCARVHGHNWVVDVYVRCRELDDIGIGLDFRHIKQAVKEVLSRLDHCNLNDLPHFRQMNPTSENIARFLYHELSKALNSETVQVSKTRVCETPGAGALYWEE